MTTITLIVVVGIWAAVVTAILVANHAVQQSRRRDREIVRRIQTYLGQLPPSRPW